jgi:hypothetical protein
MNKFLVEITLETENGVPVRVVERIVEADNYLVASMIAVTEFYGQQILKLRTKAVKC